MVRSSASPVTLPRLIAGLAFPPPVYTAAEMSGAVPPGRALGCHAGHEAHATRRVTVTLCGQGIVHEYPAIPPHLATAIDLDVYAYERYAGFRGYCTGQDESSAALSLGQVWEGYETLLTLAILHAGADLDRVVLDFGAHLGWYSTIAAVWGYDVIAFEADAENAARCAGNARLNQVDHRVHVVPTWIDETTPALPADGPEVELLKSDLEGSEHHVERVCRDLFAAGRVRYALLEISPVLADHYPETVARIAAAGYAVHDIPSKGAPAALRAAFEADPLAAIRHCRIPAADLRAYVAGLRQSNFLFVREDLACP